MFEFPAHTNWYFRSALFGLFSIGMAGSTTQLIYRNVSTIDSLQSKSKVYQLAIHDPNPPSPEPTLTPSTYRVWLPHNAPPGHPQRCFALVKTHPGENPWRLPTIYENFKESLGGGEWWTWFALWGVAPAGTSGGTHGWYRWNTQVVDRLKKEAGIRT